MQTALITTCLTVKISAGVAAEATKSPEFLRGTKWPTSLRDSVWLKCRLYTSSTSSVTFGCALSRPNRLLCAALSSPYSLIIDEALQRKHFGCAAAGRADTWASLLLATPTDAEIKIQRHQYL